MATSFPTSLDTLSNPNPSGTLQSENHSSLHINTNDAIEALETKVGVDGSADTNSLDYKVANVNKLTTKGDILVHTGTGYDRLPAGTDGYMLVTDSAQSTGLKYIATTSGGTVTSASVVSANGFAGSVASSTTTPAITMTTTVTGIVKGNGTALSAASEGTDYYKPGATDVAVADGGTGASSFTAYAPIFAGVSSTSALQSGAVGTAGQVLTSNGAGAVATFQGVPVEGKFTQTSLALPSNISWTAPGGGTNPVTQYGASTQITSGALMTGTLSLYLTGAHPSGIQTVTSSVQYSTDNSTWTDKFTVTGKYTGTYTTSINIIVPAGYYRVKVTGQADPGFANDSYLSTGNASGTTVKI